MSVDDYNVGQLVLDKSCHDYLLQELLEKSTNNQHNCCALILAYRYGKNDTMEFAKIRLKNFDKQSKTVVLYGMY